MMMMMYIVKSAAGLFTKENCHKYAISLPKTNLGSNKFKFNK